MKSVIVTPTDRPSDTAVDASPDECVFDLPSADGADETTFARTLLSNTPDAMLAMGSDHRIVFANPAAGRAFGYTPDELVGGPATRLLPERLHESLAEGSTFRFTLSTDAATQ